MGEVSMDEFRLVEERKGPPGPRPNFYSRLAQQVAAGFSLGRPDQIGLYKDGPPPMPKVHFLPSKKRRSPEPLLLKTIAVTRRLSQLIINHSWHYPRYNYPSRAVLAINKTLQYVHLYSSIEKVKLHYSNNSDQSSLLLLYLKA